MVVRDAKSASMNLEMDSMTAKVFDLPIKVFVRDIEHHKCYRCELAYYGVAMIYCLGAWSDEESFYRKLRFTYCKRPDWCPLHTAESCDAADSTAG